MFMCCLVHYVCFACSASVVLLQRFVEFGRKAFAVAAEWSVDERKQSANLANGSGRWGECDMYLGFSAKNYIFRGHCLLLQATLAQIVQSTKPIRTQLPRQICTLLGSAAQKNANIRTAIIIMSHLGNLANGFYCRLTRRPSCVPCCLPDSRTFRPN